MNSVSNRLKLTGLIRASLMGICLLAFGDASARALIGLDYSVMSGNTVQVVFTFDDTAIAPRTFTIDEPARIALDFAETENKLQQRSMQVGIGSMQSIISAASKNRTRVVINLSRKANYTTNVTGNQVTLTLAGGDEELLPVATLTVVLPVVLPRAPAEALGYLGCRQGCYQRGFQTWPEWRRSRNYRSHHDHHQHRRVA